MEVGVVNAGVSLLAELGSQAATMADRTIGQVIVYSVNSLRLPPELIGRLFGPPNIMVGFRDSFDLCYVRYGVLIYFRLNPDYEVRHPKLERVDGDIHPN